MSTFIAVECNRLGFCPAMEKGGKQYGTPVFV
jgi:hypothetical protein